MYGLAIFDLWHDLTFFGGFVFGICVPFVLTPSPCGHSPYISSETQGERIEK